MRTEVMVAGLALDERTKAPIVVLQDAANRRILPIVIGLMEASSIAAHLEGVSFPRPMTHDLLAMVIQNLGGVVETIEVTDLVDDTFFARVTIRASERVLELDARPSDSIALALRTDARIFVAESVFEKAGRAAPGDGEEELWKSVLENLEEEDFGKYKM